jgi:hypothetical protein
LIKLKLNFISNYNPHNPDSSLYKENIMSKKILCKNFIVFILFINFFKLTRLSVFIKPNFKRKFMILNAPYRYKLSKSEFQFSRFNILLVVKIKSNLPRTAVVNTILHTYRNLFLLLVKFDINLCHQDHLKVFFTFFLKENFKVVNYK